jgi:hypothetical protein
MFAPAKVNSPEKNTNKVEAIQLPISSAVEVVAESRRTADIDQASLTVSDLGVGTTGSDISKPVFLSHYRSWEQAIGHQDELTDIFSLGMLLASVACGLDFTDPGELEMFTVNRTNLFGLTPRLNPVLGSTIVHMTELNRHKRAQDLGQMISRLENYREQTVDFGSNVFAKKEFQESPITGKRKYSANPPIFASPYFVRDTPSLRCYCPWGDRPQRACSCAVRSRAPAGAREGSTGRALLSGPTWARCPAGAGMETKSSGRRADHRAIDGVGGRVCATERSAQRAVGLAEEATVRAQIRSDPSQRLGGHTGGSDGMEHGSRLGRGSSSGHGAGCGRGSGSNQTAPGAAAWRPRPQTAAAFAFGGRDPPSPPERG